MARRTVVEVIIVAGLASGLVVAGATLRPAPHLVVGARQWITSWAQPAEPAVAGGPQVAAVFPDGRAHAQTLREVLSLSLGGQAYRVRFTNEYGDVPLVITAATVAPPLAGGGIDPGQLRRLAFSGLAGTTVPAGSSTTSDPVALPVGSGQQLAVSFAIAATSPSPTVHPYTGVTSGVSAPGTGDLTGRADGSPFTIRTMAEFWLANVEVLDPAGAARGVVALGDSLTDPYMLGDGDLTWPAIVRRQLEGAPATAGIGVINGAVTGSTVTDVGCDVCGPPIVERVIRDAVNVSGVRAAIVFAGTNDITRGVTAPELVHGLASVAAVLHAHGKRAIAMTIPPRAEGAYGWSTATMDPVRRAVNGWLRGAHEFDALVDVDRMVADPVHPSRIAARYAQPDGLHLSPDGRNAVAVATLSTEPHWG